MSRRERRNFTEEFKTQMVNLFNNGKSRSGIIREYDLTASALNSWIKKYNKTGSFKACDNKSQEVKQLRMENDILKQAALIMGRK